MNLTTRLLLAALLGIALWYLATWWRLERARGGLRLPRSAELLIGFVTDFFDTLGIGCFAPTTAAFKLFKRIPDEQIPAP